MTVLVNLSLALGVSADDLLFGRQSPPKSRLLEQTVQLLESCTAQELAIILDLVKAAKLSLSRHL